MAEEEGFEPPIPCGTHDFESRAFNHSATPPHENVRPDVSDNTALFQPAISGSCLQITLSFQRIRLRFKFFYIMLDPWTGVSGARNTAGIMFLQSLREISRAAFIIKVFFKTPYNVNRPLHVSAPFPSPRFAGQGTTCHRASARVTTWQPLSHSSAKRSYKVVSSPVSAKLFSAADSTGWFSRFRNSLARFR